MIRSRKFRIIFLIVSLFIALVIIILQIIGNMVKTSVNNIQSQLRYAVNTVSSCKNSYKEDKSFEEHRRKYHESQRSNYGKIKSSKIKNTKDNK